MKGGLQRPRRVDETFESTMKRLSNLFKKIRDDRKLDVSKTALVPLTRRELSTLPMVNKKGSQENELVQILDEFGHYEKYSLFPSVKQLSKCETVIIFDDICETGTHFMQYRDYVKYLANEFELHYSKDIRTAAYIMNKDYKKVIDIDYAGDYLSGVECERRVFELYMVIDSRGLITDPSHMGIRINFGYKRDFFDIWGILEKVADASHCDLIEDGIEFLHPKRKKLAFYVKENEKQNLENLGLIFPNFIVDIDIAKFRMVFDLELDENKGRKDVFTTGFEAVPIVDPVVKNFSVDVCLDSWHPPCRFCRENMITLEFCSKAYKPKSQYLSRMYYHPRYDCIIGNIVRQFRDHFLRQIEDKFRNIEITEEWIHQERLEEYRGKIQSL